MHYEVRPAENGFEVVEMAPRVLATVPDQELARAFIMFLTQNPEAAPSLSRSEEAAVVSPIVPLPVENEPPHVEPVEPQITEQEALERLRNGAKLAAVAPLCGLTLNQLRSRWAHLKRREKKAQTVPAGLSGKGAAPSQLPAVIAAGSQKVAIMKGAIQEMSGQATCTLCKKEFTATPDNQDLCARCTHGA